MQLEVEVITFKHDTRFASLLLQLSVSGGYVNGLYKQSVTNKNLEKNIKVWKGPLL